MISVKEKNYKGDPLESPHMFRSCRVVFRGYRTEIALLTCATTSNSKGLKTTLHLKMSSLTWSVQDGTKTEKTSLIDTAVKTFQKEVVFSIN
jgi:hypothetical protein